MIYFMMTQQLVKKLLSSPTAMRKVLLYTCALLAFVACADESFVGDQEALNGADEGAISFGSSFKAITRADHVGADAADLLGNKFYVGGYKNDGSAYSTVFDHYLLQWEANTAGTTTDNTSDWKYVGLTPLGFTGHITTGTQTLKYWDFAASYYNFVAFSPGKGQSIIIEATEGHPDTDEILATAIDQANLTTAAYTLQGSATDLAECYIADLVTAIKSGASSPDVNYKDEVPLKFRRLGSKVRIALYETIPGYSIRDVEFYAADNTPIKADETGYVAPTLTPTLFASSNIFHTTGTMTIKFPTIGATNRNESDYNKAHVTFAAGDGDAPTSTMTFTGLNYEATAANWEDPRLNYTGNENKYLKRTAANPSFAGTADPYYITVLPDEAGNVLELRVDYTLESVDGTKETIKIHGAKAFVPQVYAQWKPNYAYTYIFKISDNTNGWTTELTTDPTGLYPITFDAIVLDSGDGTQSTITTVATPAITTYQKGHVYTDNDYDDDKGPIYVMVQDADLKDNLDSKGQLYTVTGSGISEATVMEALNIQVSATGTPVVITGRNGIELTEVTPTPVVEIDKDDSPDGNAVPVTRKYELTTQPAGWPTGYYTDKDCADGHAASGTFSAGTYYKKNTAVKFTPSAGKYAYAYEVSDGDDTEIHTAYVFTASNIPASSEAWDEIKSTYYTDEGCTEAVTSNDVLSLTGDATLTYYQKYTNLNKVYSVKVINVVD